MELDLETKQQLAYLLAKPSLVTQAHAGMLQNLVKTYPYYQPLHLLLAKASLNSENQNTNLATAALYNNGSLLHQVIHQPETLTQKHLNVVSFGAIKADEKQTEQIEPVENVEFIEQNPSEDLVTDEQETFEEIAEIATSPVEANNDDELLEEINEVNTAPAEVHQEDEQETFDEIIELNATEFIPTEELKSAPAFEEASNPEEALPDELAIESIVASDFFAFEKSFSTEVIAKEEAKSIPVVEEYDQEAEAQTVSKYDDDKLPYTFLWWLAKTRKEHEQIFQPYVSPKKSNNQNPSELQQQYVEHIFHLQTPFNVANEASKGPINKHVAHKGTDIIDSFIKNEPQIRPPKAEQINTENKAKKSAEDHNDLVSETLAAIYIEQMLYHKAIDTYEKLSLKFPEKSRYFADLIQSLEKKI
ncbi:hypothetical protein FA048_01365 [Pedobacter polaris]|uniref:Tetratricopeptide repeat protein n=1 Tax=Pedobacter polaris TaxID=2571273 RepID=A0A4U1CT20_9SPHI|nr:hypothetical protein [Pedobacter polaris]TKC12297.1 hypothetical protein FA048_01365 [Pedobacter polaris]